MAKFHDAIAALQGIEGDMPGDMWDTLTGAYDEDVAAVGAEINETAAAKVAALTVEADEMKKALEAAKAHNYDLLMATPQEPTGDDGETDEEEPEKEEGINALFDNDDEKDNN